MITKRYDIYTDWVLIYNTNTEYNSRDGKRLFYRFSKYLLDEGIKYKENNLEFLAPIRAKQFNRVDEFYNRTKIRISRNSTNINKNLSFNVGDMIFAPEDFLPYISTNKDYQSLSNIYSNIFALKLVNIEYDEKESIFSCFVTDYCIFNMMDYVINAKIKFINCLFDGNWNNQDEFLEKNNHLKNNISFGRNGIGYY